MCNNANMIDAGAACFNSKVKNEDLCGFTNDGAPEPGSPIEDCRAPCLNNPACIG